LCSSSAPRTTNVASGSNATKSASQPTAIRPLVGSPASVAGNSDIHRAMSASEYPRRRATDQTTEGPIWSEEIPPQAVRKSPSGSPFSSGVHGEWSETTPSIAPSPSARQSASRLTAYRIGGQHLNSV
jgi:hypothetical protein